MLNFGFMTLKRHILVQNRVFWRILRRCPWWHLGCRWFLEPQKIAEVAHARKRNPLSDLNKILQGGRYPRPNHLRKFWWRSVKRFRGNGGGVKVCASPLALIVALTTLALPCECVMWLSMNMQSLSASTTQLKLQATCAFRFMCKRMQLLRAIFPEVWELERFQTAKVTGSLNVMDISIFHRPQRLWGLIIYDAVYKSTHHHYHLSFVISKLFYFYLYYCNIATLCTL